MKSSRRTLVAAAAALLVSVRWIAADSVTVHELEKPFHRALLKAVAEHEAWEPTSDGMRWAPVMCWAPRRGPDTFSASTDWTTHGQKLYSLFARNRDAYRSLRGGGTVETGQIVVKQSWTPEEVTDQTEQAAKQAGRWHMIRSTDITGKQQYSFVLEHDIFYPLVQKGEKFFKAAGKADLFIMMKFDRKTPDTDDGWVYGTVTADGKKVTSAGKVESCIKCHREAKNERLFGLPREAPGAARE